jgi:hypothetical protein
MESIKNEFVFKGKRIWSEEGIIKIIKRKTQMQFLHKKTKIILR